MPELRVGLAALLVLLGCGAGWSLPFGAQASGLGEFLLLWLLSILLLLPLFALALAIGRKARALDPATLLAVRSRDAPPRFWLLMLDFQLLLQHLFAAAMLGVAGPALWVLLAPLLPTLVATPELPAAAQAIPDRTEAMAWMLVPLFLLGAWLLLLPKPKQPQALQALGWLLLGLLLAAAGWRLWVFGVSWPGAALRLDGEGFTVAHLVAAARLALVSLALGLLLPTALGRQLERSRSLTAIAGRWLVTLAGLALLLLWVVALPGEVEIVSSPTPTPQLGLSLIDPLRLLDPMAPERALLAIALVLSVFIGLVLLIPTAAESLAVRLSFEAPLATSISITIVWCLSMVLHVGFGAGEPAAQTAWPIDATSAIEGLARYGFPVGAAWLALYGAFGLGIAGLQPLLSLPSANVARLLAFYLLLLVAALALLAAS